ncbi:MAG: sulfotransferase [Candidatus Caenarcaniphilales bacterium]|nr:sulfotransferase [Candidatus Caenarcaniphilales bacterium]
MSVDSSKLIFVVGCPRSGTTKLTEIINKHSKIQCSSETHFFNINWELNYKLCIDEFIESNEFNNFFDHFRVQDFMKLNSLEIKDFADELRKTYELNSKDYVNKDLYIKSIFDVMVNLSLKQNDSAEFFCEKTPQHLRSVDKILKYYPEAKFVHLIRDGRDVVNSLLKMPWRPDGLINNARFWKKFVRFGIEMHEFLAKNDKSAFWFDVRYEELLEHPEELLHLLSEFLNLEYEEAMLSNEVIVDKKVFADWESKWKHKANLDLDLTRVGAYKKEMSEDDQITLNWFLQKELKELNYEVDLSNVSYKHLNFAVKGYLDLAAQKLLRFLSDLA